MRYPVYSSQPFTGRLPTQVQMGPPDLLPSSSTGPAFQARLMRPYGRHLAGPTSPSPSGLLVVVGLAALALAGAWLVSRQSMSANGRKKYKKLTRSEQKKLARIYDDTIGRGPRGTVRMTGPGWTVRRGKGPTGTLRMED